MTRGSIWIALSLYLSAELLLAFGREPRATNLARWASTVGALAFVIHAGAAFGYFHDWSHAAAYAETARQTAELTGWRSGGGIYVNYLFTVVWLAEVAWWWWHPQTHARRAEWINHAYRGFFLFMTLNGAFVFVRTPARWYGLIICLMLGVCWWRMGKRAAQQKIGLP